MFCLLVPPPSPLRKRRPKGTEGSVCIKEDEDATNTEKNLLSIIINYKQIKEFKKQTI